MAYHSLRNPHTRATRHGFSVLEMMLALMIGAVVILTARQLLQQLTITDRRLDAASRHEASERNRARYLTDALSRLEVGTDSVSTFRGEPTRAEFTTWCAVPRGWLERCGAALVIDTIAQPNTLVLVSTHGDTVLLKPNVARATFRYFSDPEDADTWVIHWGRSISAPAGLAVVMLSDTLVVRIGTRG